MPPCLPERGRETRSPPNAPSRSEILMVGTISAATQSSPVTQNQPPPALSLAGGPGEAPRGATALHLPSGCLRNPWTFTLPTPRDAPAERRGGKRGGAGRTRSSPDPAHACSRVTNPAGNAGPQDRSPGHRRPLCLPPAASAASRLHPVRAQVGEGTTSRSLERADPLPGSWEPDKPSTAPPTEHNPDHGLCYLPGGALR